MIVLKKHISSLSLPLLVQKVIFNVLCKTIGVIKWHAIYDQSISFDEIKTEIIPNYHLLISFDVRSLFISVPQGKEIFSTNIDGTN